MKYKAYSLDTGLIVANSNGVLINKTISSSDGISKLKKTNNNKRNILKNKQVNITTGSNNDSNTNTNSNSSSKKIYTTATALCNLYKINLISSSPLLQGLLIDMPLENKIGLKYNPSKHLQIIRSIPAESLKSTLVGMKSQAHIKCNLEILKVPRLTPLEFYELLTPKKRSPHIEKEFN